TNASSHHSLNAIEHIGGVPPGCQQIADAWSANGYWKADPTVDLAPPTGGLYGSASIINVPEGTMYALNATAIDGFSTIAQHSAPDDPRKPDLDSAVETTASAPVKAIVPVGAHTIEATYASPIDAVSALFMADSVYGEYVVSPSIGAQS